VNGTPGFGVFGGGYKRDVLIENSTWSFGRADGSQVYDEYDQFTNLELLNNRIRGYAAPGAEGPSEMAMLNMSEGTSGVVLDRNRFDHASTYFQSTTDDRIVGNVYTDGILQLGYAYEPYRNALAFSYLMNGAFTSFDSQESAIVERNTFTITPDFQPPWVLSVGHFASARIRENVISYDGPQNLPVIMSAGGVIGGNTISVGAASSASWGIALNPDQAPNMSAAGFDVEGNLITAPSINSAIYVADPGFWDAAPVCIERNAVNLVQGVALSVANAADISQICP
jgi:hypothetical protein